MELPFHLILILVILDKISFYYLKPHRANINAAILTYNNVPRIKYLTLNYKKIQIYNTSLCK